MQKKKIILLTILILIILSIALLILNAPKQIPQTITEQAKENYTTEIGSQTYDITNAVLEPNGITPSISAGMIPIKWNGKNFEITTTQDETWYNYSNGQPAYIMLNDGYYKSELAQGITNDQLMENSVGNDALVVPNVPNNNPTIYMYIPRFAYNNKGEIIYIKQGCSVAGTYTIPEIFTYETEKMDFSLSGIWVEYNPLANSSTVNTKINNMTGENNKYGFIANTIATNANNETSYKTMIETYNQHIANIVNGSSRTPTPTDARTKTNTVGNDAPVVPQIIDTSNPNRTILKITNSNQIEPIKGNAYYDKTEEKIKIEVTYRTNAITKIINSKGNVLSENSLTADSGEEIIGNKTYKFIVIDNLGNQKQIQTSVTGLDIYIIENEDDLKLFRNAVNSNKTTDKTKAYQIADVKMNEGKYTINEETGDITFAEDAEKWTGITRTYSGKYYGNNYTISGIYGNTGLFSTCNGAEIRDLGIKESYITASASTGAIVGSAQNNTILENCYNEAILEVKGNEVGGIVGGTSNNSSTVQLTLNNCYNNGKIIVNSAYYNIGGIVGNAGNINISNCYNTGEITSKSKPYDRQSNNGGIVGYMYYGYIQNSYNIGNITGNNNVGGIAGSISSSWSESIINNCYNIGNITGYNSVGGITGQGEVNKCYNTGNITGNKYIGGTIGNLITERGRTVADLYNYGKVFGKEYVGGICGRNSIQWGYLKNCYNIANVYGESQIAGISGENSETTIIYTYNLGEVNGKYSYIGGIVGYNIGQGSNRVSQVRFSYNLGSIIGDYYVGGVVGSNGYYDNIYKTYNSGTILGNSYFGGITGYGRGYVSSNYYKTGIAPYGDGYNQNNSGAEPLDEMPTVMSIINEQNGFKEDDSENPINNGYPILSWQTNNDKLNLINSDNAFVEDTNNINNGYPILAWQVNT